MKLKKFRARTEQTSHSEINPHADMDRIEIVRRIDWHAYDELVKQLEFTYDQRKKHGR